MKINREGKSKVLDTEELDLLLNYLPNNKHKLLAQILRKTACRVSEGIQLRYQNVTKDAIFFPKAITKAKLKSRFSVQSLGKMCTSSMFMFSRTAGNFMTKATAVIATLFIICSLALTIVSRGELTPSGSVLDTVEENSEDTPTIPENNN